MASTSTTKTTDKTTATPVEELNETVTATDINAMKKAELVALIQDNSLKVDHENIKTLPALKEAVLKILGMEDEAEEAADANVRHFTYIGGGEDSPRVIHFMGKQRFVRGQLTPVTDPEVLAKLSAGVPTFVEGEADQETLHAIDEEAKATADKQRAEDVITNQRYAKKHRTAGKGEE